MLFIIAVLVAGSLIGSCANEQEQTNRAHLLAQEVERLAGWRSLWPGFDPMAVPLAVYDGEQTYLFRHPGAPEGFAPAVNGEPPSQVFVGRFPTIVANTSAKIGATMSATLMLDDNSAERSLTDLAAVAIHEAFHVYQREQHPSWQANEADLFVYPIDDPQLLALRRLETEALRRALAGSASEDCACWARRALELRDQRFGQMDEIFADYERGTELNEGLATYVELLSKGRETVILPASGFEATDVRIRAYAIGPAFAFLLDRLSPDWQTSFENDEGQNLEKALQSALQIEAAESCEAYAFSDDDISEVERAARADTANVLAYQAERRAAFEARPGWRIVVKAAGGEPMYLQGFDPLNVESVRGDVLHERFLSLGNDACQLEVMDTEDADVEALTEGVGPHPIFNGVKEVTVAVLDEPEVAKNGEQVTVKAPGVTASFSGATVRQGIKEVVVKLEPRQ